MKLWPIACLFMLLKLSGNAQTPDTLYKYYDAKDSLCSKDSAISYSKIFQQNGNWRVLKFDVKNKWLLNSFNYLDKDMKILEGPQLYYDSSILSKVYSYENKKIKSGTYYYPNGKMNGEVSFDTSGQTIYEKGWDITGKEITDYIGYRDAEFPGGRKGWSEYLQKNLKTRIPGKNGAKAGRYSVTITFLVDKWGNLSEIHAENDPGYGTQEEAIRVITKGPRWEPAIENNKKIGWRAKQKITFMVVD